MIERIKHNMGEQVKNKTEIIILEEKTISSIVKDVFTFLCLFGMFYLNHKYTDGAGIIDCRPHDSAAGRRAEISERRRHANRL